MVKSTEQVARDVIDAIVEELDEPHGTKWWRDRAITLAVNYLGLTTQKTALRVGPGEKE